MDVDTGKIYLFLLTYKKYIMQIPNKFIEIILIALNNVYNIKISCLIRISTL